MIGNAAFGAASWLLLGYFSPIYAVVNSLLCVCFVEYWKKQEYDLAVRWGVRGVSAIENKRHDFLSEKEITDPVTGEKTQFFSGTKRLQRQLLQLPFAFLAAVVLGVLIATCFAIEIFISEIYSGPLQWILVKKVLCILKWQCLIPVAGFPPNRHPHDRSTAAPRLSHRSRGAPYQLRKLRD